MVPLLSNASQLISLDFQVDLGIGLLGDSSKSYSRFKMTILVFGQWALSTNSGQNKFKFLQEYPG